MKKFLIIVVVIVLIAGALIFLNQKRNEKTYIEFKGETWYDYGIGQYIPTMRLRSGQAPKAERESVVINSDTSMFMEIVNAEPYDDFYDYIELLMEKGFIYDAKRTTRNYEASDSEGRVIKIMNFGNGVVSIDAKLKK